MEKNGEFRPEKETQSQKEVQKVIEKTADMLYVAPSENSTKYFNKPWPTGVNRGGDAFKDTK